MIMTQNYCVLYAKTNNKEKIYPFSFDIFVTEKKNLIVSKNDVFLTMVVNKLKWL